MKRLASVLWSLLFLWRNNERVELPGNKNGKREQYTHDLIEADALKHIEKNKDNRFRLYLAPIIPHAELLVPEDSMESYKGTWPETPYINRGGGAGGSATGAYNTSEKPRAAFAGMISRMDGTIGHLLDRLKQLGIAENTLVIFTSDNGPHRDGGADPDFFDSNGPLRGYKRDMYEGGIRVPFLAWWPGRIDKGSVSDHVGYFGDFFATPLTSRESPHPQVWTASASSLLSEATTLRNAGMTISTSSFMKAMEDARSAGPIGRQSGRNGTHHSSSTT